MQTHAMGCGFELSGKKKKTYVRCLIRKGVALSPLEPEAGMVVGSDANSDPLFINKPGWYAQHGDTLGKFLLLLKSSCQR